MTPNRSAIPAVSVLLAVYNAERYVEEAVRSVLGQTFRDIEVVIVDDGSSDGSLEILKRLAAEDARIRLVSRPNKGLSVTAAEMVSLARAPLVSLMDHDDVMLPDCLATEVAYLAAHPECVAVGALSDTIDATGNITKRKRDVEIITRAVTKRPARFDCFPPLAPTISNPSAMLRTEAMRKAGSYRANMPYAHDTDLWFRLSRLGEIHRLNRVLLKYRIHGTNTTVEKRANVMIYDCVAYLSGCARAHGLDDEHLIGAFAGRENYAATISSYRQLIGDRFPVDTFLHYRAVGNRVPDIVAARDMRETIRAALAHAVSRPATRAKLQLARRIAARAKHAF